jgi:hypothetical protein
LRSRSEESVIDDASSGVIHVATKMVRENNC